MPRWEGFSITLWHYWTPSRGARVIVSLGKRNVVSSASREGMTVDDPSIQRFLAWAKDYYDGAEFREVEPCAASPSEGVTPRNGEGGEE